MDESDANWNTTCRTEEILNYLPVILTKTFLDLDHGLMSWQIYPLGTRIFAGLPH